MEITRGMQVILDIGCGKGWVSKKLVPDGKKVISMDISSENPVRAVQEVKMKSVLFHFNTEQGSV
jgi:2-polyprenyl-3-methyl-5-hydroxy-6-metoxy-1,4-benzoquinol methylase